MSAVPYITASDLPPSFGWADVVEAIRRGHRGEPATLHDQLLTRGSDTLLSRAAWIDGQGLGVKSVTIFPANGASERPTVQGIMVLFDDRTGALRALIDSDLVTYWKTAGDSVTAALALARSDSKRLLVVGAGIVGCSMVSAYASEFESLERIELYAREPTKAERVLAELGDIGVETVVVRDALRDAVGRADIVVTATTSTTPILPGAWIRSGTHVDLVGAFKVDMREADDELIRTGSLFVDSRETTVEHIGELAIPIAAGLIEPSTIRGDMADLVTERVGRTGSQEITVFKNGGGAHLDLMVAGAIIDAST